MSDCQQSGRKITEFVSYFIWFLRKSFVINFSVFYMQCRKNPIELVNKTRMTTSISREAMWNFKKYVWTLENWQNKDIKYQPRNKCFCIFIFMSFVAWFTDWCGKQNVEKESIKIKEKHTKPFNNFKLNTFTFMSFIAWTTD